MLEPRSRSCSRLSEEIVFKNGGGGDGGSWDKGRGNREGRWERERTGEREWETEREDERERTKMKQRKRRWKR